jgi:hypothetical protein
VGSDQELRLSVGQTANGVSFPDFLKKAFPHGDGKRFDARTERLA